MRKMCEMIAILFIFCAVTAAQLSAQVVKGKVLDERGDPVIGANVLEKGTRNGTITDVTGNFSLKVSSLKASLEVTYVGYVTLVLPISGQSNLNVKLKEENKSLSELVVVGYATQRKATLTGSVASVQGETLTQRSVASLSTALQGTMPGVTIQQTSGEPGADGSNIRIRGIGSINSNTYPLVLVDGIETDMNQVDMSTVESVSVLKDAASASIYGSRASNGVVLITTKKGKEGKVNVTYSGYASLQRPTNMPEPVSAWQYLQAELDSWDNAGISVTADARAQRLQLIEDQKQYKPDNWNRYDTNWKDATIKDNALLQSHNVSLSGGNSNFTYYTAGSYLYQNGLIANNHFSRATLRANAEAKITSWAKFNLETNARQSNKVSPGLATAKSIINTALYMLPTLSAVKELDGKWGYGKNGLNPVAEAEDSGTDTDVNSELLFSGTLTLSPIKNLNVSGQYSLRKVTARSRDLLTPYAVSLKGNDLGTYPSQDDLTESLGETTRNYYRAQADYHFSIARDHKISFLAGTQAEDQTYTFISASKKGFNLGLYYLDNGDGSSASNSGSASSWSMMSYYGRVNYSFQDKYLLEGNARYDGSSRFTSANRWGFFPSVSAGWVISRESFMKATQDVLSQLKLRASYGLLGNQDIGTYPYTATVNSGYSFWFDKQLATGVAQTTLANPNIKWEKSQQLNFGVDATLWNGLLSLTADYYIKKVYDMLMTFSLPYYAGMNPAYTNAGDMNNHGWEISLTHKNKIGDFSYGATFTLSDNRNKVTNLNGYNSADKSLMVGYPVNGMWGYLSDGYYKDWDDVANSVKLSSAARPGFVKYKNLDGDADIDSNDKVFLGDSYPHFEYGLKLDASWRSFDASVFIQGVGQRKIFMSGVGLKPFANGSNLFTHQLDSWTVDNPNAAYPILVPEANAADNYVLSDKWVKNAAYGRLKNVILGYTLPKKICQKLQLGSARVYLSGQNLLTLSHFYKGYDPEVSYGGTVGGEFYPIMQTYTIGIDLKF